MNMMRAWMRERVSPRQIVKGLRSQLPELLMTLRGLPPLVKSAMRRAQEGQLRVRDEADGIEALRQAIRESQGGRDTMLLAAGLLGGIIWLAVNRDPAWPGWALVGVAALGALYARVR